MKYQEGNKRGLIPHPATITRLCIRAGVKGSWAEEEECPKVSPLTLTGVSKGPRNQKKKGVIVEADSRDEEENARQEEDTLMVEDQEEQDPKTQPEGNTSMFAEDIEPDERSPIDFTTPLASSPPIRNRDFREPGESSRGAQENDQIKEMLISIQKSMEEREKKWSIQHKFREEVYEAELKRRDQQWEEELNRKEEVYEAELKRKEQKWEEEMSRREEQIKKILEHQEEKLNKEVEERGQELDDKNAYRRKVLLENLDLINNNLSKFLEVMTEMERTMNTLGQRQDDLNKKVDVTNELVLEEQIERENDKKKKRTEMKFPKFNPNLATLDLDPPNIFAPPQKRKK